jgi:hypothetical protein
MNIANFACSARSAAAWLVLTALTVSLGFQLLAQLREFRTVGSPAAGLCIADQLARNSRQASP